MFHAQNGFFFQRTEDAQVCLIVTKGALDPVEHPDAVIAKTELTAETWASAVASVCGSGESAETFGLALALHKRKVG